MAFGWVERRRVFGCGALGGGLLVDRRCGGFGEGVGGRGISGAVVMGRGIWSRKGNLAGDRSGVLDQDFFQFCGAANAGD